MPSSPSRYRAPAFIASIVELAADVLAQSGKLDQLEALELANAIAAGVAVTWGGQHMYIPRAVWNQNNELWCQRWERDMRIYRAYTGSNVEELSTRFGLDSSTVRRILARVREHLRSPETIPAVAAPQPPSVAPHAAREPGPSTVTMPAAPRPLSLFDQAD